MSTNVRGPPGFALASNLYRSGSYREGGFVLYAPYGDRRADISNTGDGSKLHRYKPLDTRHVVGHDANHVVERARHQIALHHFFATKNGAFEGGRLVCRFSIATET